MPTKTSNTLERRFATSQRVRTPAPRYIVKAMSVYGECEHEFVDLKVALSKVEELMTLGIPHVSIDLSIPLSLPLER